MSVLALVVQDGAGTNIFLGHRSIIRAQEVFRLSQLVHARLQQGGGAGADRGAVVLPGELGACRAQYRRLHECMLLAVTLDESSGAGRFDGSGCLTDAARVLLSACRSQKSQTVTVRELQNKRERLSDELEKCLYGEQALGSKQTDTSRNWSEVRSMTEADEALRQQLEQVDFSLPESLLSVARKQNVPPQTPSRKSARDLWALSEDHFVPALQLPSVGEASSTCEGEGHSEGHTNAEASDAQSEISWDSSTTLSHASRPHGSRERSPARPPLSAERAGGYALPADRTSRPVPVPPPPVAEVEPEPEPEPILEEPQHVPGPCHGEDLGRRFALPEPEPEPEPQPEPEPEPEPEPDTEHCAVMVTERVAAVIVAGSLTSKFSVSGQISARAAPSGGELRFCLRHAANIAGETVQLSGGTTHDQSNEGLFHCTLPPRSPRDPAPADHPLLTYKAVDAFRKPPLLVRAEWRMFDQERVVTVNLRAGSHLTAPLRGLRLGSQLGGNAPISRHKWVPDAEPQDSVRLEADRWLLIQLQVRDAASCLRFAVLTTTR